MGGGQCASSSYPSTIRSTVLSPDLPMTRRTSWSGRDIMRTIKALKAESGGDIITFGSPPSRSSASAEHRFTQVGSIANEYGYCASLHNTPAGNRIIDTTSGPAVEECRTGTTGQVAVVRRSGGRTSNRAAHMYLPDALLPHPQ